MIFLYFHRTKTRTGEEHVCQWGMLIQQLFSLLNVTCAQLKLFMSLYLCLVSYKTGVWFFLAVTSLWLLPHWRRFFKTVRRNICPQILEVLCVVWLSTSSNSFLIVSLQYGWFQLTVLCFPSYWSGTWYLSDDIRGLAFFFFSVTLPRTSQKYYIKCFLIFCLYIKEVILRRTSEQF